MKVDIFVYGDLEQGKVAFLRQHEADLHYRAQVPDGSSLADNEKFGSLLLPNGRRLCALEVFIYAKVDAEGFRILDQDSEAKGPRTSGSEALTFARKAARG
ncbi:MAG: hypothetical protein ACTHOU_14830 [Aureliella sp.]